MLNATLNDTDTGAGRKYTQKKIQSASAFRPQAFSILKKIFAEIGEPVQTGFIPDDFQLDAVEKIRLSDVLVSAPTGSGKTWIAEKTIEQMLQQGRSCWYASPLKALSNSKYSEFSSLFGKDNVGILTGERKENTDASVVVGTTEILRNQLYDSMHLGIDFRADLVVLDEAHYLGDTDRGVVWEEVMIYLPQRVRLLMLSATVRNPDDIAGWLSRIRQHPCLVVKSDVRPVPIHPVYLLPDGKLVPLLNGNALSKEIVHLFKHIDLSEKNRSFRKRQTAAISYNDAMSALKQFNLLPAVFFLRSRDECNSALFACRKHKLPPAKQMLLNEKLEELLAEYPFLKNNPQLDYIIENGIAAHHGGQIIHWKIIVEKLMNMGCLDAIFSTSTVAAGVNFPARTVVLVQSDRYNGKRFVELSSTELHQAIGRAGRRGKDKIGFTLITHGPFQNPFLIKKLIASPPDPIDSQIKINFSMSLNLLLSHSPEEIKDLLAQSFATHQNTEKVRCLEQEHRLLTEELNGRIKQGYCNDYLEISEKIKQWKDTNKRLSRFEKKKKKLLKKYPGYNSRDMDGRILSLERRVERIACNLCQVFPVCHEGADKAFFGKLFRAEDLYQRIHSVENLLWNEFQHHLQFLVLNGFADDQGGLTSDGIWASKLRLEHPLIIAELIRKGVLNRLSPELLCGIVAIFVNDKFRDLDINSGMKWNKRPLISAYYRMKDAVAEIMKLKQQNGFAVPQTQFWPAAALYSWCSGETWENVIHLTSVDEGDLAMLVFRTADNLRQLTALKETHPELASIAQGCLQMILREPVIIPT